MPEWKETPEERESRRSREAGISDKDYSDRDYSSRDYSSTRTWDDMDWTSRWRETPEERAARRDYEAQQIVDRYFGSYTSEDRGYYPSYGEYGVYSNAPQLPGLTPYYSYSDFPLSYTPPSKPTEKKPQEEPYWTDYSKLAYWKAYADGNPGQTEVDKKLIDSAFDVLNTINKGEHWSKWQKPEFGSDVYQFLAQLPEPASIAKQKEAQRQAEIAKAEALARAQETNKGVYQFETDIRDSYDTLASWQKLALILTGNATPIENRDQISMLAAKTMSDIYTTLGYSAGGMTAGTLIGGAIGGIAGLLGGGAGAIPGALAGASIGNKIGLITGITAGLYKSVSDEANVNVPMLDDLVQYFQVPADALEAVVGLSNASKYGAAREIAMGLKRAKDELMQGDVQGAISEIKPLYEAGRLSYESGAAKGLIDEALQAVLPKETSDYLYKTLNLDDTNNLLAYIFGDRVAPEGYHWEYSAGKRYPVKDVGAVGTKELEELYKKAKQGATREELESDAYLRRRDSATITDFANQMLYDPLNVAPFAESLAGEKIAKWAKAETLATAFKMNRGNLLIDILPFGFQQAAELITGKRSSGGLISSLLTYRDLLQAGFVPPKYKDVVTPRSKLAGIVERMAGGIDETGKIAELGKTKNRLFAFFDNLTDGAKAHVFMDNLLDSMKAMSLAIIDNPTLTDEEKAYKLVDAYWRMGSTDPIEVGKVADAVFKSPVAATVAGAISGVVREGVLKTELEIFRNTRHVANVLQLIANDMGIDPHKLIADIAKDREGAFERIKKFVEKSNDRKLDFIKERIASGDLDANKLYDLFRPFDETKVGKQNVAPITIDEFNARITNIIADRAQDWLIQNLELKQDPLFVRLTGLMKALMSIPLLDFSLKYLTQNLINNVITRAAQGFLSFTPPGRIRRTFERMKIGETSRMAGFVGTEILPGGYSKLIRATQGDGYIARLTRSINQYRRVFGVMARASGAVESMEAAQVVHAGIKKAWNALWRQDVGYPRMSNELETALKAIDPKLPDKIYNTINRSMNMDEVFDGLYKEKKFDFADAYESVINEYGKERADQIRDMLSSLGIDDELAKYAERIGKKEDVDVAFSYAQRNIEDIINKQFLESIRAKAEEVKAEAAQEGVIGAINIINDIDNKLFESWVKHFEDTGKIYSENYKELSVEQRNALWRSFIASDSMNWDKLYAYEMNAYTAMLEGLSAPQEVMNAALEAIKQRAKAWSEFYNGYYIVDENGNTIQRSGRNKLYNDYFENLVKSETASKEDLALAWQKIRNELKVMSQEAEVKERKAREQLYDAIISMFPETKRQFAEEWKNTMLSMRDEMIASRNKFNENLDTIPSGTEEYYKAKRAFWDEYIKSVKKMRDINEQLLKNVVAEMNGMNIPSMKIDDATKSKISNVIKDLNDNINSKTNFSNTLDELASIYADKEADPLKHSQLKQSIAAYAMLYASERGWSINSYRDAIPYVIGSVDRIKTRIFRDELSEFLDKVSRKTKIDPESIRKKFDSITEDLDFKSLHGNAEKLKELFDKLLKEKGNKLTADDIKKFFYCWNANQITSVLGSQIGYDGKIPQKLAYDLGFHNVLEGDPKKNIRKIIDYVIGKESKRQGITPLKLLIKEESADDLIANGTRLYAELMNRGLPIDEIRKDLFGIEGELFDGVGYKADTQSKFYKGDAKAKADPVPFVLDELMRSQITDILESFRRKAIDSFENPSPGMNIPNDVKDLFNRYVNEVRSYMASAKLASIRFGNTMRDMSLLNYSRQSPIDQVANLFFPYQFWYTRTMMNWAARMIDKPQWFATYARLKDMQRKNEINGFPTRLKDKMRIYAPFLPSWAGNTIYVDPYSNIFPFSQLTTIGDRFADREKMKNTIAIDNLREWLSKGEITQQQYNDAINKKEGYYWEKALLAASEEVPTDPGTLASMMLSPNLFYTLLNNVSNPEKNSVMPITQTSRAIEYALKNTPLQFVGDMIGNLAYPETRIREKLGLGQYGEYTDWYIARQIANMVAEGIVNAEDAKKALINKEGDIYNQALERVKFEQSIKTPGVLAAEALKRGAKPGEVIAAALSGLFPNGLFPEGELKLRGIQNEYKAAWARYTAGDKNAIRDFLDKYPEYGARIMALKDPEERLRYYLIDKIWSGWYNLPERNRALISDQFGDIFKDAFLSSETRDYNAINLNLLAAWARALNNNQTFGVEKNLPSDQYSNIVVNPSLYPPEVLNEINKYYQERNKKFPGLNIIENLYYGNGKPKELLRQFPLLEYWKWKREYKKNNPIIAAYTDINSGEQDFLGYEAERLGITKFEPELSRQLFQYVYDGKKMTPGAVARLEAIWKSKGKPEKTFEKYIEKIIEYARPSKKVQAPAVSGEKK